MCICILILKIYLFQHYCTSSHHTNWSVGRQWGRVCSVLVAAVLILSIICVSPETLVSEVGGLGLIPPPTEGPELAATAVEE